MQLLNKKLNKLKTILQEMDRVIVAFSGGVDSTFLLKVATEILGERAIAVTATSPTYPEDELLEAKKLATSFAADHFIIETSELQNKNFTNNPPDRCYHCKNELYTKLKEIASKHNTLFIVDGANSDDSFDFRPGQKAAIEQGVRSPLKEAELSKEEIRFLSKELNLPTWNKPAFACLASRFPYEHKITVEKLNQVQKTETFLRLKGLKTLRVRHHEDTARIEVEPTDLLSLCKDPLRKEVVEYFKKIGFTYITLDLMGFRSGSMNEVLSEEIING